MWTVTPRFLQAIPQPHTIGTLISCTPPGGSPVALSLVSGTWASASGQIIRRTAPLVVDGGSEVYGLLSTPGAIVRVLHGMKWAAGATEYVPIITGELSAAATQHGDGTVSATIADLGQRITGTPPLTAISPAPTANRLATIAAAVTASIPGIAVEIDASDTGTIGVSQTWTDRDGLITDLATDAGAEAYFLPDGSFRIRDLPQVSDEPVWTLKPGPGGTITAFARNRPLDKLYNTVIVTPDSSSGTQTWTQQVAQISDTSNPRHPNYINVRPFTWQSPTLMDAASALAVAELLLTKVQGSTETLAIDAIANAALDAGDVVRIVDPAESGYAITNHIIDSLTGDLVTGAMTFQTRAASEGLA